MRTFIAQCVYGRWRLGSSLASWHLPSPSLSSPAAGGRHSRGVCDRSRLCSSWNCFNFFDVDILHAVFLSAGGGVKQMSQVFDFLGGFFWSHWQQFFSRRQSERARSRLVRRWPGKNIKNFFFNVFISNIFYNKIWTVASLCRVIRFLIMVFFGHFWFILVPTKFTLPS